MKLKQIIFCVALLFSALGASGQCTPLYFDNLDGNQVDARIYNGSSMFWDLEGSPKYEVPKGGNVHSAFSSSLWIGGLDNNGDLHVAANTYRQSGTDFFPGPYRWTGNYDCGNTFETTATPNQLLALADGRVVFIRPLGMEVYDPATGSGVAYNFPVIRPYARGLQLQDGRVLIYGGSNPPAQTPLYLVDTSNFNISVSSTLSNWQGLAQAIQLPNGEVLFAGSFGADLFDPATGTVSPAANMLMPRIRGTVTLLPSGEVLVAGGSGNLSGSNPMNTTEIYNPTSNTWTNGPVMGVGRVDCEITDMGNGALLISGGAIASGIMDHFDLATSTISQGGVISPRFDIHVAKLLSNGQVAIACNDQSSERIDFFKYTPGQSAIEAGHISGMGGRGTVLPNGNFFLNFHAPNSNQEYSEIDSEILAPAYQRWQKIWKVNQADVDQFRLDFANNTVDFNNYPVVEDWPAHGDPVLGEQYYMAPFVDVDLDGVYDPLNDGDYPCVEGDQALWWVFNDDAGPHTETGADKMGLQVKAMAYVYDCQSQVCPHTSIDFATFYRYEITNRSAVNYSDTYLGIWLDLDLGSFSDDYVGCDTTRGIGFGYNGSPVDPNYGANPPAIGLRMLDTPGNPKMTNFMYYENDFSVRGNPTQPEHYYNYLQSVWTDNTHLTEGGNGYGGNVPTNYMFSGDAGWCGGASDGWTEIVEGNQPFDRRMLQSYGPFNLSAGETVNLDFVVIWSRAFYNDNLGSVCEMQTASDSIASWYASQDHRCFNVITERPDPRPLTVGFDLYPNPTAGNVAMELSEVAAVDTPIAIFDQTGRQVGRSVLPAGELKLTLETADFPNGVYMVKMGGKNGQTQKLIVQH